MGDGIAHFDFGTGLDAGDDIADIAGADLTARRHVETEDTYLVGVVLLAGVDEAHFVAGVHGTVDHFEIGDDASEGIEDRVENEALQRCVRIAYGCRYALDDGIENLGHAVTRLG